MNAKFLKGGGENDMKHVLITGGCGFVGTNLISYLKSNTDMDIRVFDNESLGDRKYIVEFGVDFVKGDITDPRQLMAALNGIDAVVHLAADTRVMDSIEDPSHNFKNNVFGTFNLLDCMRNSNVMRIINASTGGAILGETAPPLNEDMPAKPLSPYGASKLAAEGYCSAFFGSYGIVDTSLRFSNVYGPRSQNKGSVVAKFMKNIIAGKELVVYGDGSQTRDFIFIDDLCEGIWQAMLSGKRGVYQLGTGTATTIQQLVEHIAIVVGEEIQFDVRYCEFREGEVKSTWCDITKAKTELGFLPKTPIEVGIRQTWEWFLNG